MPAAVDQWHLEAIGQPALAARGWLGGGVRVAVIDTGVVGGHPHLSADRVEARDAREGRDDPEDRAGHGTAMVGFLVGAGVGVAPHARVVSYKAANSSTVYPVHVEAALDLAIEDGCHVASLSLSHPNDRPELSAAVSRAAAAGLVLVAATDNEDPNRVVYPAEHQQVLAVGAFDRNGQIRLGAFPTWMDLAMPGQDVVGLTRGADYDWITGSSPATALAAGVCAALLSAAGGEAARRALARELTRILRESVQAPEPASPGRVLNLAAAMAKVETWLANFNDP